MYNKFLESHRDVLNFFSVERMVAVLEKLRFFRLLDWLLFKGYVTLRFIDTKILSRFKRMYLSYVIAVTLTLIINNYLNSIKKGIEKYPALEMFLSRLPIRWGLIGNYSRLRVAVCEILILFILFRILKLFAWLSRLVMLYLRSRRLTGLDMIGNGKIDFNNEVTNSLEKIGNCKVNSLPKIDIMCISGYDLFCKNGTILHDSFFKTNMPIRVIISNPTKTNKYLLQRYDNLGLRNVYADYKFYKAEIESSIRFLHDRKVASKNVSFVRHSGPYDWRMVLIRCNHPTCRRCHAAHVQSYLPVVANVHAAETTSYIYKPPFSKMISLIDTYNEIFDRRWDQLNNVVK